jgi:hypothetical protein
MTLEQNPALTILMNQSGPDADIGPLANEADRVLAHVPLDFALADTQFRPFVSHDADYHRFVVFHYVTEIIGI